MEKKLEFENYYYEQGCTSVCGVDEAGRGPLAGPVCAAAVILPKGLLIEGVDDSKKLSEKKREILFDIIKEKAVAYNIAWASVEEIESMNILNAAMLAMKRAVEGLPVKADFALIDGNKRPSLEIPCVDIVKGDSKSESIAAASILAKVSRDRLMIEYAEKYPVYGFEKHKGYPSEYHADMIRQYGPCEIHRMSFLTGILHPELKKPRTKAQRMGAKGEAAALEYLTENGYSFLEKNYRSGHGEIDLIVQKDGCVIFVEVKTRDEAAIARPSDSVTARKRKKLIETANAYIIEKGSTLQPRFDVVEVVYTSGTKHPQITHIENAFGEE
ncbi:MAG: ribonuclease HII [Clostridia bacterium]|nr:ribonuclease HII [Clostridia bacterium]